MNKILTIIIFLLAVALYYTYRDKKKYDEDYELRKYIAECITINCKQFVESVQYSLDIPVDCKLTESEEWDFVQCILQEHERDLVRKYFKDELRAVSINSHWPSLDYFILSLQSYLRKHWYDTWFCNHKMYEALNHNDYLDSGRDRNVQRYALTKFSAAYTKLYYISYLYCKESKALNPEQNLFNDDSDIKRALDSQHLLIPNRWF